MEIKLSEIQKEKLVFGNGNLYLDYVKEGTTVSRNRFSGGDYKTPDYVVSHNLNESRDFDLNVIPCSVLEEFLEAVLINNPPYPTSEKTYKELKQKIKSDGLREEEKKRRLIDFIKYNLDNSISSPYSAQVKSKFLTSEVRKKLSQEDVTNLERATLVDGYLNYELEGHEPLHVSLKGSVVTLTAELKETLRNFAKRAPKGTSPVEVQAEALQGK